MARQDDIRRVLDDVARRRGAGEVISDEKIISRHAHLMPELGDALSRTRTYDDRSPDSAETILRGRAGAATPRIPPGFSAGDRSGTNGAASLNVDSMPAIPGYRFVRKISSGGQAVVFEAIRESTGARIALKIMHEGPLASPQERARFDREVKVLASLNHPHIVQVVDRGVTADGTMYLAMSYIEGQSLGDWLADYYRKTPPAPPPLASRQALTPVLRVFVKICDAVNAAHLRGVVHRDLKPANIRVDGHDEPHILDFGLARTALREFVDEGESRPVTTTGHFMGSLPWASPEQADGRAADVDTRSDVYSLGVILYQSVTGKFPYDVTGTMRQTLDNILNATPAPPSAVENESEKGGREASKSRWSLSRTSPDTYKEEIDAIVAKALAKLPADRFQTAGEFSRDVANLLEGRPVQSLGFRPTKPGRSKMPLYVGTAVLLLALGAALGLMVSRRGDPKPVTKNESEPLSATALVSSPTPIKGVESWTISTAAARGLATSFSPDGKLIAVSDSDGTVRLLDANTGAIVRMFVGAEAEIRVTAWSRDSRFVAVGTMDQVMRVWDVSSGRLVFSHRFESGSVRGIDWSADGKRMLSAGQDWTIRLWDTQSWEVLASWSSENSPFWVVFSPDDKSVATGHLDGMVRIWDLESRRVVKRLSKHASVPYSIAWSPDGKRLASMDGEAADDSRMKVWDIDTAKILYETPSRGWQYVNSLIWLDDESLGYLGGYGEAIIWDASDWKQRPWKAPSGFPGASRRLDSPTISRDGKRKVVREKVFDIETNKELLRITSHSSDSFSDGRFSPDGKTIVFGGKKMAILNAGALKPGTSASDDAQAVTVIDAGRANVQFPNYSPDGRKIAFVVTERQLCLWDVSTGKTTDLYGIASSADAVSCLAWSPDGSKIAAGTRHGNRVYVIPVASPGSSLILEGHKDWLRNVVWAENGKLLISSSKDSHVIFWDLQSEKPAPVEPLSWAAKGVPPLLAISPDGTLLAAGGELEGKSAVGIWRVPTGEYVGHCNGGTGVITFLAFSSDGKSLYTIARDLQLRTWDVASQRETSAVRVPCVGTLSPDGKTLMCSNLQFYDAAARRAVMTLLPMQDTDLLIIEPSGRFLGPPKVESKLIYVARINGEQKVFTPDEFARQFNWRGVIAN